MQTTKFIYVLKDPETAQIRYVGCSEDPERRLRNHLSPGNAKLGFPVHQWIKELTVRGLKPVLEILCRTDNMECERREIAKLRKAGHPLLNVANGGRGGMGKVGVITAHPTVPKRS